MFIRNLIICLALLWPAQQVAAACTILNSAGKIAEAADDHLAKVLQSSSKCPTDVFSFRSLLLQSGLNIETTLVANRGFHNPRQGSFSLFEIPTGIFVKSGEFFFGHFTTVNASNHLVADQNPQKNALMIEAFAWDPKKQWFNFYELRGDGQKGQWFYRGDSADILADNTLLHRKATPEQRKFGGRLRCSACHQAGGPIMKELQSPHNDWWEPNRPLDFGGRKPDASLNAMLKTLVPAEKLSQHVKAGLRTLQTSKGFSERMAVLSLQEQLRPLFCPMELNIESDIPSNDVRHSTVQIPVDFFVDSRLVARKPTLLISRTYYENVLNTFKSHFPETSLPDADHAWLTPVKALSDKTAVEQLISNAVIDHKFMADVLSVDFTHPVFSKARCDLLKLVPNEKTADWQQVFIQNLSKSNSPAAKELFSLQTNPKMTASIHQDKISEYLKSQQEKLSNPKEIVRLYENLIQQRNEIRLSEISKNPLGQILEPGFRVIFPENK